MKDENSNGNKQILKFVVCVLDNNCDRYLCLAKGFTNYIKIIAHHDSIIVDDFINSSVFIELCENMNSGEQIKGSCETRDSQVE